MMTHYRKLRAELKKLNGLQWDKKSQRNYAMEQQAKAQRRIDRNSSRNVPFHEGAEYVPQAAVQIFYKMADHISRLTKDMNKRKAKINKLNAELQVIKTRKRELYAKGTVFTKSEKAS